jgi:hypothetical protein
MVKLVIGGRREPNEARLAVRGVDEHAVGEDGMIVRMRVHGRTEALDERDGCGLGPLVAERPSPLALPRRRAQEQIEDASKRRGCAQKAPPQVEGHRERCGGLRPGRDVVVKCDRVDGSRATVAGGDLGRTIDRREARLGERPGEIGFG